MGICSDCALKGFLRSTLLKGMSPLMAAWAMAFTSSSSGKRPIFIFFGGVTSLVCRSEDGEEEGGDDNNGAESGTFTGDCTLPSGFRKLELGAVCSKEELPPKD